MKYAMTGRIIRYKAQFFFNSHARRSDSGLHGFLFFAFMADILFTIRIPFPVGHVTGKGTAIAVAPFGCRHIIQLYLFY